MATETPYLSPDVVDLFLRKLVKDKKAETSDQVGALLGGTHLTVVRLRKKGGDYADALALSAILEGLEPFSAETLKGEELPVISSAKTGHALVRQPPKKKETAAEYRARVEAEIRADIEAELRAKYQIADEPETVAA